MNARDQRNRQQFHETEKLDTAQAAVFTPRIATALLHPLVEDIEVGAGGKMPKPAAKDNRAAAGFLRLFDLFDDGIDKLRSQQIVGPINHGQHGDIAALLARNQCILGHHAPPSSAPRASLLIEARLQHDLHFASHVSPMSAN